jgi:energy-coupling factor transporter ATP-binding protein EcfA2
MTQIGDDDPTPAPSAPIPVRVKKYAISDFRAFPGPELYEFEVNGRNLLLWGENGSGKTSFYKALQALLDPQNETPFAEYKNIFSSTPDPFEEGVVSIELDNTTPSVFLWSHGEERPTDYSFRQMATRATFLDYKSLLRAQADDAEAFDLFPLLINVLLRYVTNPATGQTFHEDWQKINNFEPVVYFRNDEDEDDVVEPELSEEELANLAPPVYLGGLEIVVIRTPEEQLTEAVRIFRRQLMGFLGTLESTTNEFLRYFLGRGDSRSSDTEIRFELSETLHLEDPAQLRAEIHVRLRHSYGGATITTPATFLNEARLSALSISLYLAAAYQNSTPATVTVADQLYELPRLLVLDDVLIGLDLSHRLPLLSLLEEHFADWQIVLTTFDRVWFELAQIHVNDRNWAFCELFRGHQNNGIHHFDVPYLRPSGTSGLKDYFLAQAEAQLADHNWRGAVMYTRVAFEAEVKSVCAKFNLPVPYQLEGSYPDTDEFLRSIEIWLKSRGIYPKHLPALEQVKLHRKRVLNAMSHYLPSTLAENEIRSTIAAIRNLELTKDNTGRAASGTLWNGYEYLKEVRKQLLDFSADPTLVFDHTQLLCKLRSGFECELMLFCEQISLPIGYKHQPTEQTVSTLWEATKAALTTAAVTDSPTFISAIEQHRTFLLEEATIDSLTTINLGTAQQIVDILLLDEGGQIKGAFGKMKSEILRSRNMGGSS